MTLRRWISLAAVDARKTLTDVFMKTMNIVHRSTITLTGGRFGHEIGSMPVVRLVHTGRKSGKTYTTMLTSPVHDGDTYVLVASKGGDDRDPQWYGNIVAHPDVDLLVKDETLPMTARTVTDEERDELWPRIVETYKGYAGYQARTDRTIPVVICEPRR